MYLARVNVSPDTVEEVYWGVGDTSPCKDPYTPVAARQSLIKARLPADTVSTSFDMACVSAMHAVKLAAQLSIAINANRMPEGPGFAMQKVLRKAALSLDDMSVMEINEAFAAVTLVSMKILSEGDEKELKEIQDRTNINGSAIAIGHPNTASGARIIMNLIYELRQTARRWLCPGGYLRRSGAG